MQEFIKKVFKWNWQELFKAVFGIFLFSFAINIFITPMNLYNGGILGLSQLIRTALNDYFGLNFSFDISGIINFIINIPLFILAYCSIGKTFFSRTVFCVSIQTIFLSVIPTLTEPIISDMLTSCLIGGIIAGVGSGFLLSTGSSGGGTDIIGIAASLKNRNLSVGKVGLAVNIVIYAICGYLYGLSIMIYSLIYSAIGTIVVDNTHEQNVCSTVMIFTKKKPTKIIRYIENEIDRGTTTWEGKGGYKNTTTYITYAVMSNYELQKLERHIRDLDKDAFITKTSGVGIDGNFTKSLV